MGKGRLLVCSLNLSDSDPAAAYFRRCLLAYAGGEQFQPRTQVTPEQLVLIIKYVPVASQPMGIPNRGFDEHGQLPTRKIKP